MNKIMLNPYNVNMFIQEFKFIHYEKRLKLNPYKEEIDLLINLFFMNINFKSTVVIGITGLDDIQPKKLTQRKKENLDFFFSIFEDIVNMFNFYYYSETRVSFKKIKKSNKMILTIVSTIKK